MRAAPTFLLVTLAGCASPTPALPPPVPIPSATPRASAAPPTREVIVDETTFVVAGPHGVLELAADGATKRRLGTATDATAPRFLPGGHGVLFLQGNDRLVEVDRRSGAERIVAGPFDPWRACPGQRPVTLFLQSDDDLVLDADGRHVCIDLRDRNMNMMSFAASLRIDRATGAVETRWTMGCEGAEAAEGFRCSGAKPSPSAPAATAAFPHDFEASTSTLRRGDAVVAKLPGWFTETRSPDGRWLVLRGNLAEGDYIHANLLAVDRRTGAVFPIPSSDGDAPSAFPAPLGAADLADPSRPRLGDRAGDFVGETTVRFLDGTTLFVGGLVLFLDARRLVRTGGELAH